MSASEAALSQSIQASSEFQDDVEREREMTRNRKKRQGYFTLYTPPSSAPLPQLPPPPELVRAGAVSREERFLRGDYDHFEQEAVNRALGRIAAADQTTPGVP
jgi:hypothetical protein